MTRHPPPSSIQLTPHPASEGWISAKLHVPKTRAEEWEVASLLRRRGVVARLREEATLSAQEVYAVLSNNPGAECSALSLTCRAVKRGDLHSPRSILTVPGRVEVLARCPVVAAVVAAAHTTRRPMVALSALAGRLLMEGRAVLRVIE